MEESKVLRTTEEIKAISDPYRLKILNILSKFPEGATATMIAEKMNEVPSKVHYHIKKLEKAGIIELTNTEVINGIIAKYYMKTAEYFTIEGEDSDNPIILNETFKVIKNIYDESLSYMKEAINNKKSGADPTVTSASEVYLTKEEVEELLEYIKTINNKKTVREGAHKAHVLFSIVRRQE